MAARGLHIQAAVAAEAILDTVIITGGVEEEETSSWVFGSSTDANKNPVREIVVEGETGANEDDTAMIASKAVNRSWIALIMMLVMM